MTGTAQQEGLSPDLIPSISKRDVNMAVVTLSTTTWTRQMDHDLEVEVGPVQFQVVSSFHGVLRDGQTIEVTAKRILDPSAAIRHNFDAWNTLSLNPGETLILAVRPANVPPGWEAVAAQDISGPAASVVEAVRRAYVIEQAPGDLARKTALVDSALQSNQELLVFYALDFLRRHAGNRELAVRILGSAASSPPPSDLKLEMGRALIDGEFFIRDAKADPANTLVVSSLSIALTHETDGPRRAYWLQLIGSCVLMNFTGNEAENLKIRHALTHSHAGPTTGQVASAIAASTAFVKPDAQPNLRELQRIWQTP